MNMRSYGQYCAVAKALDVVGDRWTLLIVRELLVRACRYRDLQDSLPGVATNLLAERIRHLENAGVVTRDDQLRYRLTAWGEDLAEPLYALARWASPLMRDMQDGESFRSQWLSAPIAFVYGGVDPSRPAFVAEIRTGGAPVTMQSADGKVQFHPGPAASPDLMLSGPPDAIIGLLVGRLNKKEAVAAGAKILGDMRPLAQLRAPDWLTGPETRQPTAQPQPTIR
jgi:DNA-binding HxlR family transcriptional regulator